MVTGANRGIGRAIAEELARRGTLVVAAARHPAAARETAGTIVAAGGRAVGVVCDVSVRESIESAVSRAVQQTGRIDILVNNAGIDDPNPIWDMTDQQWDRVIATNLTGPFLCTRAVVRASMREHGGSIVNISSHNGIRGSRNRVNYSSSKAGLLGLTKSCALELGSLGVRVNAVAPGAVITDMTEGLRADDVLRERFLSEILVGRFGEPRDVAHAVAFLAGPESAWITGKVLIVDGGAITAA